MQKESSINYNTVQKEIKYCDAGEGAGLTLCDVTSKIGKKFDRYYLQAA